MNRSIQLAVTVLLGLLCQLQSYATDYTWSTTNGNYNLAGNWNPGGGPPGLSDNALINAAGSYTVTLNDNRSINNLTLNAGGALFSHTGGTYSVGGAVNVSAGTYELNGGSINGGSLNVSGAGVFRPANTVSNILNGVIFTGPMSMSNSSSSITLTGNSSFTAGSSVNMNGSFTTVAVNQTGVIDNVAITMGSSAHLSAQNSTTLTWGNNAILNCLSSGSSISSNFIGGGSGNSSLINNGTISSSTTGALTIDVNGTVTNTGVISASNGGTVSIQPLGGFVNTGILQSSSTGKVYVATDITTANLGNWNSNGGDGITVGLGATLNNTGDILQITNVRGSLSLSTGTIFGGSVVATAPLVSKGDDALNNVIFSGTANITSGILKIAGNTTFNAGSVINNGRVLSVSQNGTIDNVNITLGGFARISVEGPFTFTLGNNATISSSDLCSIGSNANGGTGISSMINNGTITTTSAFCSLVININGTLTNSGTISATNSSSITLAPGSGLVLNPGSSLTTTSGGTIIISTATTTNNGTINTSSGSTLNLNSGNGLLINNNQLTVNGTLNGTLQVNNGGNITGTANITRSVTVQAGGILDPGNSPGSITVGTGITINGEYHWDLGSNTTSGPGTNFDVVRVSSGNVVIGLNATLRLALFNGTLNDPFFSTPQQWIIIDNQGTGTTSGLFSTSNIIGGIQPNGFFDTFIAGTNNNDLFLRWNIAAVPEPATWAMIALTGLSVGGYGWHRQRRRQRFLDSI